MFMSSHDTLGGRLASYSSCSVWPSSRACQTSTQAPVVAPTETTKAVVSTSTQVGPKQPAPSKVKADAFTIQFTAEGIQYAFIKMGDVWLALRASVKQPNVYSAFAVAQRCAKRQGGKGLIANEGIFVSMKAPGIPTVNPQTKRVILPWKIGVTYDDTGHFSDGVAHLTISRR